MIWILCNMLWGCGGGHLNEFGAYHCSREKANQSLPLRGDGYVGGRVEWETERSRDVTREREGEPFSPLVLSSTTAHCWGFSWGTLVLIKTVPILNSNPLVCLLSSDSVLSNHWNKWMFLHYHNWSVSVIFLQYFLVPGMCWAILTACVDIKHTPCHF